MSILYIIVLETKTCVLCSWSSVYNQNKFDWENDSFESVLFSESVESVGIKLQGIVFVSDLFQRK